MSAADKSAATTKCPECGIVLRPGDKRCWLCRTELPTNFDENHFSDLSSSAAAAEPAHGFSLATLMMFVTLLCVVFGLSTIAPGIGIPLGILLFIAWGRTVSVSHHRAKIGKRLSATQQVRMYFEALGFVVALLILVTVGICCALWSICVGIGAMSSSFGGSFSSFISIILFGAVAVLGTIAVFRLASKWNDANWRRMAGEDDKKPADKVMK
jgi:hypothetical protein